MPTTPSPSTAHKEHIMTLLDTPTPTTTGEQHKKARRGGEAKKRRKEWKRSLLHLLIHTFAFLFVSALVFRAYEQVFHPSAEGYKAGGLFNSQLIDYWEESGWLWLPGSARLSASEEKKKCVVDAKKKKQVEEEVRKKAIAQICNDPDGFVKDQKNTFLEPLTFADFECGLAAAFGGDEKYKIVAGSAITLSKKGVGDLKFPMMQRGKWCRYDIWRLKKFKKKMSK